MSTKHTPGPWRISRYAETSVEGPNEFGIAACGGYQNNMLDASQLLETQKANAHLIAAAPDLYEALQSIVDSVFYMNHGHVDSLQISYEQIAQAKAALKKARGES